MSHCMDRQAQHEGAVRSVRSKPDPNAIVGGDPSRTFSAKGGSDSTRRPAPFAVPLRLNLAYIRFMHSFNRNRTVLQLASMIAWMVAGPLVLRNSLWGAQGQWDLQERLQDEHAAGADLEWTGSQFQQMVKLRYRVGEELPLTVLRDGKEIDVLLPLVE